MQGARDLPGLTKFLEERKGSKKKASKDKKDEL